MRVLYHLPVLPPKHPTAEALSQEIALLSRRFNGRINYINPNVNSPIYIPRLGFGFHQLRALRQLEAEFDLHHVYNPDPFPYPIFRLLKKPTVYSLSSRLENGRMNAGYFSKMAAVTVYDEGSQTKLTQMGLTNAHFISSGIDKSRFTPHALPHVNSPFLIASAPWVPRHFVEKGIDVLLDTAVSLPNLRLIFLWRGELFEEMMAKINGRHLANRVQVIDGVVDVNAQLKDVIATINLATHSGVVKAYPNSLMDSISAARPVIISNTLAMAQDVTAHKLGVVVDDISIASLTQAIETVRENHAAYYQNVVEKGPTLYHVEQTLLSFGQVYAAVMKGADGQ